MCSKHGARMLRFAVGCPLALHNAEWKLESFGSAHFEFQGGHHQLRCSFRFSFKEAGELIERRACYICVINRGKHRLGGKMDLMKMDQWWTWTWEPNISLHPMRKCCLGEKLVLMGVRSSLVVLTFTSKIYKRSFGENGREESPWWKIPSLENSVHQTTQFSSIYFLVMLSVGFRHYSQKTQRGIEHLKLSTKGDRQDWKLYGRTTLLILQATWSF